MNKTVRVLVVPSSAACLGRIFSCGRNLSQDRGHHSLERECSRWTPAIVQVTWENSCYRIPCERTLVFVGSGAPPTTLENPPEGITFTPGRTHNRSRSPSRQNRSVTSGKGLALRAGVRCNGEKAALTQGGFYPVL
ncbi:hypothetical protein NA57DRAFT_49695 [Rhizodiscina lignyota]|uniref:Uncharacterized protein n=1 Tax=Rhizodiscina lignyota TaxID=1504668 RepID=A0A9P4I0G1_9PEZI|nr:hypothetical protein NA57DRAFT_49695 [Rhizodiscina lignyota]